MSTTRAYRSPHRAAQALATRESIILAAAGLFEQRGYAGTTMRAIAESAGVAVESVYALGSKSSLLLLALEAVRGGGTDSVPVTEMPLARQIAAATDQRVQIRLLAQFATQLISRVASIERAFGAAAQGDPELRRMWDEAMQRRLGDATAMMKAVNANGPLKMTAELAGQTLWAVVNADTWHLLTGQLGWAPEQFSQWLEDLLVSAVLP